MAAVSVLVVLFVSLLEERVEALDRGRAAAVPARLAPLQVDLAGVEQ